MIGYSNPDFAFEDMQCGPVIGLDEVGRGPLAGPVMAAAVYIPLENRQHPVWNSVRDSKQISPLKREALFSLIQSQCVYAVASASVEEIDALNILQATFLAMRRAVEMLTIRPAHLLIDGNRTPKNWPWSSQAIIKGDTKSVSIAAASILAKVTRDRLMAELAKNYPHYGWEKNAGYGAPVHLEALNDHGITPHHRTSFAPVRKKITQFVT
ncbi:MAG: ribonuclease HII [Pseudomonadota bacterium]